jgi:hypothetical protein
MSSWPCSSELHLVITAPETLVTKGEVFCLSVPINGLEMSLTKCKTHQEEKTPTRLPLVTQ